MNTADGAVKAGLSILRVWKNPFFYDNFYRIDFSNETYREGL